jgi:hypothetical protein
MFPCLRALSKSAPRTGVARSSRNGCCSHASLECEAEFEFPLASPEDDGEPVRDSVPELRRLEPEASPLPARTLDRSPLISEPERVPPLFPVPECDAPEPPEFERELPESPREELPELALPELDERLLSELLLELDERELSELLLELDERVSELLLEPE